MENELSSLGSSGDVLFLMLGAVMVFAMHGGFAFLEVGTVRKKNQVNALVKILVDSNLLKVANSPSLSAVYLTCSEPGLIPKIAFGFILLLTASSTMEAALVKSS